MSKFKKNFKYYILIGVIVALAGVLATVLCFFIGRGAENSNQEFAAMMSGIMSGALTSTPAFSASKATAATVASSARSILSAADAEALVSVGYGIAYIFGVIGVVMFVQLVPKLSRANMEEERAKISIVDTGTHTIPKRRFVVEPQGLFVFAFVLVTGILIGAIRTPLTKAGFSGVTFSLTSTGGVLLSSLIVGHKGHVGPFSNNLSKTRCRLCVNWGLSSSWSVRVFPEE